MIEFLGEVVAWFTDPVNWTGVNGIPNRTWEHIQITVAATSVAAAVAIPIAVWLGHRKTGGTLAVAAVNIGRAIPSFAIIALFLPISIRLGLGLGFWPTFLALLFLAIPPMFTNAYTGVAGVDPALVEAARGMGLTERRIVTDVELPMASPVILAAIRVAAVQVIATATLGALVAWGGLGRYIIDGFSTQDSVEVFAGAVLVAGLALITEVVLGWVERRLVPVTLRDTAQDVETVPA
ncbi:MAG: ABC transporter permease [Actinomycetota bacterium]|nr:ABC transporter permease [Actinomycetota bacterium]